MRHLYVSFFLVTTFNADYALSADHDQQDSTILVEFPTQNPVQLGTGWSLVDNAGVLQKCILFDTAKLSFQDKRLRATVVEDHEALSNALELSVSAKYNGALSNFSANAGYVHKTKFESSSTYVAVVAEVSEGPDFVIPTGTTSPAAPNTTIDKVSLHPDFAKMASEDINEFRRQCGQGFIAVIHSGAKINATLQFLNTSLTEHEKITATVSGGGGGGSFSASLTKLMDSYETSEKLTVSYLGLGGAQDTIPLTKDGIIKAAETLPAQSRAAPRPFTMIVQRYEDLPNWPQVIIPAKISDVEILARAYWRLFTLRQYAEEAIFEGGWILKLDTTRQDVLELEASIQQSMDTLREKLWECASNDQCDASSWADWNDYEIRSKLPFRGDWSAIAYNPGSIDFDEIAANLGEARMNKWIVPAWRSRCARGECIPAVQIENYREQITQRIASHFN